MLPSRLKASRPRDALRSVLIEGLKSNCALHRPNCGESDLSFAGECESFQNADTLAALIGALGLGKPLAAAQFEVTETARWLAASADLEIFRECKSLTDIKLHDTSVGEVGLTFDTIAAIAATGVDYASSGALTHSAPNFDVAIDIDA